MGSVRRLESFRYLLGLCRPGGLTDFRFTYSAQDGEDLRGVIAQALLDAKHAPYLRTVLIDTINAYPSDPAGWASGRHGDPTLKAGLRGFGRLESLTISMENIWYPTFVYGQGLGCKKAKGHDSWRRPDRLSGILPRSLRELIITHVHAVPVAAIRDVLAECGPGGTLGNLRRIIIETVNRQSIQARKKSWREADLEKKIWKDLKRDFASQGVKFVLSDSWVLCFELPELKG